MNTRCIGVHDVTVHLCFDARARKILIKHGGDVCFLVENDWTHCLSQKCAHFGQVHADGLSLDWKPLVSHIRATGNARVVIESHLMHCSRYLNLFASGNARIESAAREPLKASHLFECVHDNAVIWVDCSAYIAFVIANDCGKICGSTHMEANGILMVNQHNNGRICNVHAGPDVRVDGVVASPDGLVFEGDNRTKSSIVMCCCGSRPIPLRPAQ